MYAMMANDTRDMNPKLTFPLSLVKYVAENNDIFIFSFDLPVHIVWNCPRIRLIPLKLQDKRLEYEVERERGMYQWTEMESERESKTNKKKTTHNFDH